MVYTLSEVLSIRIRKELREMMKKVDIDWRREIESFIESKIREYEKKKTLDSINELLRDTPTSERPAWIDIREDREGG